METEASQPQLDRPAGGLSLLIAIAIVAAASIGFAVMISSPTRRMPPRPAPEIVAEGWLNGPGPTAGDLKGKVIVLEAWAYWCAPCRAQAPELVELYNRYKDRVVFLGLTSEGLDVDERNREFLKDTRITWPNGYGAINTLIELKADRIPQRWVIDRQYHLIWDESAPESIESAIDRALADKP